MQKQVWILLLLLTLLIPAVTAQDTAIETTVGPVTVTHSDGWHVLEGPAGTVIMAEFDPTLITAINPMPEDAIVVQLRLFGLNRIAGVVESELTPYNIAGGLLANDPGRGGELPEIIEVAGETYNFARVDVSSPELASYVYVTVFNNVTFGIITTSASGEITILDNAEARIIELLETITLNFETPFPEDAFTRYEALTRGLTAEGFPMLGNPDAPVTVMEIASFDCVECRIFHTDLLPDLLTRIESGDVKFIFVPIYGTGTIPLGDSAARAALCVGTENFWSFHDVLFSWQDFDGFAFIYERLQAGAANTVAIPPATFDECYTSAATNEVLEAARQQTFAVLGEQWRGLTLIVNGTIINQISIETLLGAIDNALENQ